MKPLSVIVVGYNSPAEVDALLESLAKLPSWESMEVLVGENGNQAIPAMAAICERHGARFASFPNPGFGTACNRLAALATGECLAFVNPDTLFQQDIFPPLVALCRQDPSVGACAPRISNLDGSDQISWNDPMGLFWELMEATGLQTPWRQRMIGKRALANPDGPWTVGFSSGACLVVPASVFREIGGFDEEFFLNYEDIELCDRIRATGRSVQVLPELRIFHHNSVIQGRDLSGFVHHRLQAKWLYLRKHYPRPQRWLAMLLWWFQALLRLGAGCLLFKGSERTRLPGYLAACLERFRKRTVTR